MSRKKPEFVPWLTVQLSDGTIVVLTRLSVGDLVGPSGGKMSSILDCARRSGLLDCPPGVGEALVDRLCPRHGRRRVECANPTLLGMEPQPTADGGGVLPTIVPPRRGHGPKLDVSRVHGPDNCLASGVGMVFALG